jgi:glycosyltransferase involved in cell wall biosynthesis
MRILTVIEAAAAGAGRHVMDLMRGLRDRGHSATLVYSPVRADAAFRDFAAGWGSGDVHAIPMRRGPHWSDLQVVRALRGIVEAAGPFDVVHGHSSKAGLLVRAKGLAPGAGVVYTPHGVFTANPANGRLSRFVGRVIERTLARRSDALVAVSPFERDHLGTLGIPADKVHFVPNGMRAIAWPSRADARADAGLDEDEVVVGYIGRLMPEKDPLLAVESFARIALRFPRAVLAMVGEGPDRESCDRRVAELGLEARVLWLGYRRAEQILPAFDVMLIPSRYESWPYVALEAMSAGVPVVAAAFAGLKVIVQQRRTGLLVETRTPESFGASLDELLSDAPLRRWMAEQAVRRARDFTVETMVDSTLDVYRHAVARRRDQRPVRDGFKAPRARPSRSGR